MSKRAQLKQTLVTLTDLKNIFSAMKNLSVVEAAKLSRFLAVQGNTIGNIENVIADFRGSYGAALCEPLNAEAAPGIVVLIGTERGFCGAFNDRVVQRFEAAYPEVTSSAAVSVIVVGSRLAAKMERDPRVRVKLPGATVVEEIADVMSGLLDTLLRWEPRSPLDLVRILSNAAIGSGLEIRDIAPVRRFLTVGSRRFSSRVRIDLPLDQFLTKLLEHYFFALLEEIFSLSLMAEHRERLKLMEGAVHELEKDRAQTLTEMNRLRQEEITEEIEVILLNAGR